VRSSGARKFALKELSRPFDRFPFDPCIQNQEDSMSFYKCFRPATMACLASALLISLSAAAAQAKELEWNGIFGLIEAFNVVGVGTPTPPDNPTSGAVTGAAPWVTTSGHAKVDLDSGKANFRVKGLVLAVGSQAVSAGNTLSGLGIGTNAGVTMVKGTLVCNISGKTGPDQVSVEDDTTPVALSFQGNASFYGSLVDPVPSVCLTNPEDTAFLIRIVQPSPFFDLWIAFGGGLKVEGD
jgi:hypothetical protein